MSIKNGHFTYGIDLLVWMDHKPLQKIFTGSTNNEKCNTWDLEATTIPRCIKLQNITGIANILADSLSRLKVVGLYHSLDPLSHYPH